MGGRAMTDAQHAVPPLRGMTSEGPAGGRARNPADAIERLTLRIRLRAQLRVLWLRTLWRRETDRETQRVVSHAQVDAALEGWDTPEAEAAFRLGFPAARQAVEALARVEAAMEADRTDRLGKLASLFALTRPEVDLLQACLAASLDPALARVFAYLQDVATRSYVTEELAAQLFDHGPSAVLDAGSALRRWQLVTEEPVAAGEPPALLCDPLIRAWMLGGHHLDEALVGVAGPHAAPAQPLPRWPVDETAARIERILATAGRARVVVRERPAAAGARSPPRLPRASACGFSSSMPTRSTTRTGRGCSFGRSGRRSSIASRWPGRASA